MLLMIWAQVHFSGETILVDKYVRCYPSALFKRKDESGFSIVPSSRSGWAIS